MKLKNQYPPCFSRAKTPQQPMFNSNTYEGKNFPRNVSFLKEHIAMVPTPPQKPAPSNKKNDQKKSPIRVKKVQSRTNSIMQLLNRIDSQSKSASSKKHFSSNQNVNKRDQIKKPLQLQDNPLHVRNISNLFPQSQGSSQDEINLENYGYSDIVQVKKNQQVQLKPRTAEGCRMTRNRNLLMAQEAELSKKANSQKNVQQQKCILDGSIQPLSDLEQLQIPIQSLSGLTQEQDIFLRLSPKAQTSDQIQKEEVSENQYPK